MSINVFLLLKHSDKPATQLKGHNTFTGGTALCAPSPAGYGPVSTVSNRNSKLFFIFYLNYLNYISSLNLSYILRNTLVSLFIELMMIRS